MANSDEKGPEIDVRAPSSQDFRFTEGVDIVSDFARTMGGQAIMLSDHEGQFKSFASVISAVQASLQSWKTTAIGIAGALGVAVALLGAFNILTYTKIDTLNDNVTEQLSDVRNDLNQISAAQRALPGELAQQMLSVAASLAIVRGEQEPAQSPNQP